MTKSRDSQACEVPHLDINPSPGQESGWELEDVHRLQEHQCRMSKRLLPTTRDTQQDKVATYQRLVDGAFQSQIRRNLEAYVDDMVVKSKSQREMLADLAETFDNLRRINMMLNPKKCSFGVEEGNFLGYMVTSEGIRANPAKTKDIAKMKSPRTWGKCKA
ncbi:reverse transcriptase domain-containing protein [Tanacetum coccineum]